MRKVTTLCLIGILRGRVYEMRDGVGNCPYRVVDGKTEFVPVDCLFQEGETTRMSPEIDLQDWISSLEMRPAKPEDFNIWAKEAENNTIFCPSPDGRPYRKFRPNMFGKGWLVEYID